MGPHSYLLLMALPVPADGSPPDWAAAHAAVDRLTTTDLSGRLLDTLDLLLVDVEETEAGYNARVLASVQQHLHNRLRQLQEAYADGDADMSWELTHLPVFGRRLLITGGGSFGGPPTDAFTVLDELTEFPAIVAALGGDTKPDPAHASTPSIEPGQALAIDGLGRWALDAAGKLTKAPGNQPVVATAEIGSVVHLPGHGHYLVELDDAPQAGDDGRSVALTLLSPAN